MIKVYWLRIKNEKRNRAVLVSDNIKVPDALDVIAAELRVPYRDVELITIFENDYHSTLDFENVSPGIWM